MLLLSVLLLVVNTVTAFAFILTFVEHDLIYRRLAAKAAAENCACGRAK
ncbi:MAG: hypothetical protein H0A75_06715 [Candidatus Methanofishera endochildressiae]|uniref:Uncharacterized protein n=1 Tax=Candidatus Methanofishera endochildressiae TaxID=2738884 RepID=A0A7Z0MP97_9GAMM|nr:hypothetical protein [Candidatus Methanofishera endochildressiae]